MAPQLPTPQLSHESTFQEILHGFITLGILAASIFVKNPQSQQRAATVINAINGVMPMVETGGENTLQHILPLQAPPK